MPRSPEAFMVEGRTTGGVTVAELWHWLTADGVSEGLLDWAPDVAALTTVLLERSQAFRFVVSPPAGTAWPPADDAPFSDRVAGTAGQWRELMDRGDGGAPDLVKRLWAAVLEQLQTPVSELADGRPWSLCRAVLTLHAIADEATAGCGGTSVTTGSLYLARAREMLTRTGSLARLPADRVALLPKTRTTPVGMTHRSLSRYSCASTYGIPAVWHRAPLRRLGAEPAARHANVLLLPWPLRIREWDFQPVAGSVRRPEREPFGFFHYKPSESLDLDLVERLLESALDEVDHVDVVALPEGCLEESEVAGLEALLARYRVPLLVAGLRIEPAGEDRLPGNGVHIGMQLGEDWWHYRQNKHHRWFLDSGQVEQYNIAGALHPSVRWWEAMEIPKRAVNIFELGSGITVAAVVCEDLARLDGVAELLRSVGPTLVVTLLLDGPQLASRWTARYAGVLADDPGSAVVTLTAFGMTSRSRPGGLPPSPVVAMWKDPLRGIREIPLENGAQGVLLKAVQGLSPRYAADGRRPVDDATDLYVAGIHQIRVDAPRTPAERDLTRTSSEPALDPDELSILTSWADAVAYALGGASDRTGAARGNTVEDARIRLGEVLAQAGPGAPWRAERGLPRPSDRLTEAIGALGVLGEVLLEKAARPSVDELLVALEHHRPEERHQRLARRVLRSALDAARQA